MKKIEPRLYACPQCKTDAWSSPDAPLAEPACDRCGRTMKVMYGTAALLPEETEPVDRSLTAYLAGPLPEEAIVQTENPANLFGKYILLRELGRGATGRVIKAWDTYLSRHVALKFLHSTVPKNVEMDATERVQDFLREARLAARLQHPNIIRIHEVDCREGRYFICMDFVDGGTLADLIHGTEERKIRTLFYRSPARLLSLLRSIAIAVHHAHTQIPPVVHRDLKPQNVLIDGQGQPHVADFGLANEVIEAGDGGPGGIRGTPAYMAPEQALGENGDIDARTDVYSLGIILYEMLAGEPPFQGSNIPSVLRKIVTDPPEPPGRVIAKHPSKSREVAACPPELRADLEAICLRALAKNREDRYRTALEFADALEPWTRDVPRDPAARTTEIRGLFRKRRSRVVALITVPLLVLLLVLSVRFRSVPPATAHASAPGDDLAQLASALHSSGKWTTLRGVVTELRRRAADHPRLKEFERALEERGAQLERGRKEWTEALDRLVSGAVDPEDLRRRVREFPELEAEFRGALSRSLARRQAALLDDARALSAAGPGDAWLAADLKERATATREGVGRLAALEGDPEFGIDARPLSEARTLLDRVLAWRGSWNLRVNVHPYAEFRVVQGDRELVRDFTPGAARQLEVGTAETTLELYWPSQKDPQRRWSAPLPNLKAGENIVVSGSIERTNIEVERK